MANWSTLIVHEMGQHDDSGPLVGCTLTDAERWAEFCDSYGLPEGKTFTAWTASRVYFPICYDGAEWVGSAPRDPCEEATEHMGGG